jgi:hypothetical protein
VNSIFSTSVLTRAHTFDVEADANDIKFHIEKEIMQSTSLYNIVTEPPLMLEDVVNTIKHKLEGLYVAHSLCYTRYHADIVLASFSASSIYSFCALILTGYP